MQADTIVSICLERFDEYFDLHVPGPEHYFAEGILHHNSGKTLANLLKILHFGDAHPGARMLILRKTRASLTESALVTWERDVLGPGHPVLGHAINRGNRHSYRWPNGSTLVTGGIDRPDKILSTEWDLIYVPEANELTLAEWETLAGRLRAGAGPYDLLFGDVNPTTPSHWIYQRAKAGKLRLLSSTLKDNPRYWDAVHKRWTADGLRYYTNRLLPLTGARRKRFLLGEWAAAEGLVYDAYSPAVHDLPAGWSPPPSWEIIWGLDFGYNNPSAITVWAIDGDGRMYLWKEIYRTEMRVELLAKLAASEFLAHGYRPVAVVCDHDSENVKNFEVYSGLHLTPADKQQRDDGIEEMQGRFDVRPDGRPRVFFGLDTLVHPPDPKLVDAGKPTCLRDELLCYRMDLSNPNRLKDTPLKRDDHGADSMRYVSRWVDTYRSGSTLPDTAPAFRPPDPLQPRGTITWR